MAEYFANTGNMTFNGGGFQESYVHEQRRGDRHRWHGPRRRRFVHERRRRNVHDHRRQQLHADYLPHHSSGTFINEGTFTKSGGTGTSEFPQYPNNRLATLA